MAQDLPILPFPSTADFRNWLTDNHVSSPGIWLKIAKKGSGQPSVTYAEALDVALCFGWIDGQKKAFDDAHWLQRFTPRRAGSKWSEINVGRVIALIASGEMHPAGMSQVEAAKADGRWTSAYAGMATIGVPDDLAAALRANPEAAAFFETLNRQNRYAVLYRIQDARKPETRQARIERFVAMLGRGETLYP